MGKEKELELKIKCHIYIKMDDEGEAKEKLEWFESLSREQGFDYQIYEEEIQDLA